MQIIWYGQSCFKIISGETSLLTDPFSPAVVGLKNPRLSANVFLFSSSKDLEERKQLAENFFSFFTPGEYEVKNIFIHGFYHKEKDISKTIYLIEAENIKICFLGEISKSPSKECLEKIEKSEIVILPVAGGSVFSVKEAINLLKEFEPRLVILSDWNLNKKDSLPKVVEKFIEEGNWAEVEKLEKLRIKKKELPEGKTRLVILKPNLSSE